MIKDDIDLLDQHSRTDLSRNFNEIAQRLDASDSEDQASRVSINGVEYDSAGERLDEIEKIIQNSQHYNLPGKDGAEPTESWQESDGWGHRRPTPTVNIKSPYYSSDLMLQRINSSWHSYAIGGSYHHWFEIKKQDINGKPISPKLDRIAEQPISPAYIMVKHPFAAAMINAGPSDAKFIMNGQVIRDETTGSANGSGVDDTYGTVAIMKNGTGRWYSKAVSARQMVQDGVAYATSSFPPIILGGKAVDWSQFGWRDQDINQKNPRTLLVEKENAWAFVTVIGRFNDSPGMSYKELASWMLKEGGSEAPTHMGNVNNGKVINVFNMDGGGSCFMALDGQNVAPMLDRQGRDPRKLMGVWYFEQEGANNYPIKPPLSKFMAGQMSAMNDAMYNGRMDPMYFNGANQRVSKRG